MKRPMSAPLSPSEWKTRRSLIDPKLNTLGWNVAKKDATSTKVPPGTTTLTEYPTDNGPADYALCNAGRVVGIIEAKRLAVSPAGVLEQAERYARGLPTAGPFDFGGLRAPFLYATNGEVIHFHDVRDPPQPVPQGEAVPHTGRARGTARPRLHHRVPAARCEPQQAPLAAPIPARGECCG